MRKKMLLLAALLSVTFTFGSGVAFSAYKAVAEEPTQDTTTDVEDGETEGEEEEEDPFAESHGTRYEAEDGTGANVEVKGAAGTVDYGSYSGTGFVGCIDFADSAVTFKVTVETSGEYELYIRYATGTNGSTVKVYNDSGLYNEVKCQYTTSWGSFNITPLAATSISLNEGENHVKIGKGLGYVELDYIEIGARIGDYRESSVKDVDIRKPTVGFTRYEAEKGIVTDGVKYSSGVFSGAGYVGNLDLSSSNVEFTVTVESDGEYEIGVAYAIDPSFSAASLRIFNEDGFYGSVRCEVKLGWGSFSKEALVVGLVSLRAGENKVGIWRGQNFAQLDFIEIGAKVGDYKQGGDKTGDGAPAPENYVRYEAENGTVVNAIRKGGGYLNDYGNNNYSSKGFVGSLDNDKCYIDIPVTVSETGMYEVKLRYATGMEGAKLTILAGNYGRDGRLQVYNDFACSHVTDWGVFEEEGTLTANVGLKPGDFIRIMGTYAEVDYIDLGAKVGEFEEGTNVVIGNSSGSFGDGAFGEEEDDGYIRAKEPVAVEKGCSSSLVTLPFAVVALGAVALCLKRKENE